MLFRSNICAIDKGSNMVVKFNPQGRVVWVFGRKQEAADGAEPLGHPDPPLPPVDGNFRQPTDVAWDSQGNTYITDGYINSRVAKFDKNGDWVKSVGLGCGFGLVCAASRGDPRCAAGGGRINNGSSVN